MTMAPEALASSTSLSVMAPTPRCTTSTLTSGVERWAGVLAADEGVAQPQRAVLDQDRGERPLAGVECRLEHGAVGAFVRVRLEIEQLGLEQDLLEQRVHVRPLLCRDGRRQGGAAELL